MQTNNKLREACANIAEYARSAMCHTTDAHVLGYLNQIEGWAKVALAAPPRNCDRLNVDDAFEAFTFMCDNTDCRDCPYKQNNKYGDRELCAMLFLYDNGNGGKEGGAK